MNKSPIFSVTIRENYNSNNKEDIKVVGFHIYKIGRLHYYPSCKHNLFLDIDSYSIVTNIKRKYRYSENYKPKLCLDNATIVSIHEKVGNKNNSTVCAVNVIITEETFNNYKIEEILKRSDIGDIIAKTFIGELLDNMSEKLKY
jgi:hypothetical protein